MNRHAQDHAEDAILRVAAVGCLLLILIILALEALFS